MSGLHCGSCTCTYSDDPDFMTIDEAAACFDITPRKFHSLMKKRIINLKPAAYYGFGGGFTRPVYARIEIEALLQSVDYDTIRFS